VARLYNKKAALTLRQYVAKLFSIHGCSSKEKTVLYRSA